MSSIKKKWQVDEELVKELRETFLAELEESDPDLYHPDDIARVKENDWFVARYILHQRKNVQNALNMMKESLKFRKEFGINTLSRSEIPNEFFNIRATFLYNKDKSGFTVIMVRTKEHVKEEKFKKLQQLYLLYWFEKAIKNADWGIVTVIFDCTGAGISNVDVDLLRFILNLLKKYYPWALNYFIVYNMPWYLTGIWKLVKPWVPQQHINRIKFVDQTTIRELIEPDQLPIAMGGTCEKLYEPKEGAELPDEDDVSIPQTTEC